MKNILEIFLSGISLYIAYLMYKLNKKETNPKISFEPYIEVASMKNYNKNKIFSDKLYILYNELEELEKKEGHIKGFPSIEHEKQIIYLKMFNRGDYPATSIEIDLELKIKKASWNTDTDEFDIIDESIRYLDYRSISKKIKIDYMPSNSMKKIDLCYVSGKFISMDIYISCKSKEENFIKNKIKIFTYIHKDLKDGLSDSVHLRKILGIQ